MAVEVTVTGVVAGEPEVRSNRAGDVHVRFVVVSTHQVDHRLHSFVHISALPPLADRVVAELRDGTTVRVMSDFVEAEICREPGGTSRARAVIRATDVQILEQSVADKSLDAGAGL